MLTPDYLDTLPDALVQLWQQVEDDILRDVARRIGKMDGLTGTAEWQLWRLQQTQALRMDVVRLLTQYSGKTETEVRRLLQQAGTATLAGDDEAYLAMGLSPPDINSSPALLNLLNAGYRQTLGSWQNLTATTANTVTREFENALDRAWLQVSSGAFDYKTSIKRAVDELARSMKYIEYPSGHRDTLEVAVRRAVLTGVNQTGLKLQMARMDEMAEQGFENFVEVTAHTGARSDGSGGASDHAAWQGKVYHRGGRIFYKGEWYGDFETATGYGTGEGLGGWNCRHGFYPFWPGLSVRSHTDEQLAAMNEASVPYNGKLYTRYEINQMQRALERKVRSAKRRYLAESEAGVDASHSAVRLKAARQQLSEFIRSTGGRADSARTGVAGFGRSAAGKATWAAKRVSTNPQNFATMKAITGARITNPTGRAANEHAKRYYGLVRAMQTDVSHIAKNTGYPEAQIAAVKNYLFIDKHDLGDPEPRRFDADFAIAQSWQRLISGTPKPHDYTLLKHEILERQLVERGMSQDDAHILTSATYDYSKEADAYYGSLKKHPNK